MVFDFSVNRKKERNVNLRDSPFFPRAFRVVLTPPT